MFRIVTVHRGSRVVHLVDGAFRRVLTPGRHLVLTLGGVHELLPVKVDLATAVLALSHDDPVPADAGGFTLVEIGPLERGIALLHGSVAAYLGPGRYRWWDELGKPEILRTDLQAQPTPLAHADPAQASFEAWFTVVAYPTPVQWIRDGRPAAVLPAGTYRVWKGSPWSLRPVPRDLQAVGAEALVPPPAGARLVEVASHERVAAWVDGAFLRVVGPGRYLWWEAAGRLQVARHDLRAEPAPLAADDALPAGPTHEEVTGSAGQAAVLVHDGQPERALPPGRYRAWLGSRWGVKGVPLSLQSLDVAPQDLLTEDHVPVRLKAAVTVRVADPVKVLSQPDWANQVYAAVQLAMREVVCGRALEALLADRGPAGDALLRRGRELLPDVGLALESAAIKDVILPGEVKDLLNRVTLARKDAEALAIKRREETAQTRQLANTARLLENNPVLMRLKELEALGDLAARIERITLVGSGDLVRQVLLSNLAGGEVAPPRPEPGE